MHSLGSKRQNFRVEIRKAANRKLINEQRRTLTLQNHRFNHLRNMLVCKPDETKLIDIINILAEQDIFHGTQQDQNQELITEVCHYLAAFMESTADYETLKIILAGLLNICVEPILSISHSKIIIEIILQQKAIRQKFDLQCAYQIQSIYTEFLLNGKYPFIYLQELVSTVTMDLDPYHTHARPELLASTCQALTHIFKDNQHEALCWTYLPQFIMLVIKLIKGWATQQQSHFLKFISFGVSKCANLISNSCGHNIITVCMQAYFNMVDNNHKVWVWTILHSICTYKPSLVEYIINKYFNKIMALYAIEGLTVRISILNLMVVIYQTETDLAYEYFTQNNYFTCLLRELSDYDHQQYIMLKLVIFHLSLLRHPIQNQFLVLLHHNNFVDQIQSVMQHESLIGKCKDLLHAYKTVT